MLARLRQLVGLERRAAAGAWGEAEAAAWLEGQRGFRILARNWRNPRDRRSELDLVARDREVLVFVEVKTRAMGALVGGYAAVDERKRRALARARAANHQARPPTRPPPTYPLFRVAVDDPPEAGP
ncbi:MAG: YraN family protein, partial [Opitutaceae bacterium]